ncbi:hypothetical protein [Hymenobacter cellulosivorans]|uniref:Uncharacterized protein n=1 Tax=Hymenobacter cellulosivorans TaxID=2932249 RepID=A0ABY4FCI3_9BACT|nr:hypothetical protein [Hymenobacter cellulosivorans]UOQ54140.1 hypothetical protein MUN80_05095 [Hymenobacter cellulosivorans]
MRKLTARVGLSVGGNSSAGAVVTESGRRAFRTVSGGKVNWIETEVAGGKGLSPSPTLPAAAPRLISSQPKTSNSRRARMAQRLWAT